MTGAGVVTAAVGCEGSVADGIGTVLVGAARMGTTFREDGVQLGRWAIAGAGIAPRSGGGVGPGFIKGRVAIGDGCAIAIGEGVIAVIVAGGIIIGDAT